jgi:hypothetical protein
MAAAAVYMLIRSPEEIITTKVAEEALPSEQRQRVEPRRVA